MIASGYEAQCWLRQHVTKNLGSYAYISDPIDAAELRWLASTLLWESALRSTGDGRLLVGGEDDDRDIPARRDRLVDRKVTTL